MYRIMPKSDKTLTTTLVGEWLIADSDKKDVDDEMRLFQYVHFVQWFTS
jgi:hypothetical protein